jgi:hypothetical protein
VPRPPPAGIATMAVPAGMARPLRPGVLDVVTQLGVHSRAELAHRVADEAWRATFEAVSRDVALLGLGDEWDAYLGAADARG